MLPSMARLSVASLGPKRDGPKRRGSTDEAAEELPARDTALELVMEISANPQCLAAQEQDKYMAQFGKYLTLLRDSHIVDWVNGVARAWKRPEHNFRTLLRQIKAIRAEGDTVPDAGDEMSPLKKN